MSVPGLFHFGGVGRLSMSRVNPEQKFLNETEVSALIGRSVQTLRNDRCQRRGLPYVKYFRQIRYALSDVLAAMAAHRIMPGGNGGDHE
jgi:hypothetical protein